MNFLPEKYENHIQFFQFILKYYNSDVFKSATDLSTENGADAQQQLKPAPAELVDDLKKNGTDLH